MFNKLIGILLLTLSANTFALEFPVEITEYFDGIKVDAYIKESDINKKSQWKPFDAAPPLSVDQALSAVQKHIMDKTKFTNTTLLAIELKPLPHHDTYWHYLVKMKVESNNEFQPHFFIVLLDGKVISAVIEPETIK